MNLRFEQLSIRERGFTLGEILVSLAITGVVGLVLFSVLQAGSVLLAKNTGINITHGNARLAADRLLALIQSAVASPILVDSSLNPISGDGPAAGITFLRLASTSTYSNVNNVSASATTLRVHRTAGMPAAEVGDVLIMIGTDATTFATTDVIGFQASITGVSVINSTDSTITFGSTVGSLCSPPATSGSVLLANAKLFLLDKMACVANGMELRLLNNASSPGSYQVLAQLVPLAGEKQLFPFRYTTEDRHWVDVDLRVESTAYNQRQLGTSNTFFDLKESIAYRSAVVVQASP
jgi:type II secretory pathway pseudopilin PulG